MNEGEKELLKAGADAAMRPFANLIERLFGGSVEQIGGQWEDRLKVRRQIRQIKLMQKLDRAIEEAGIDAQPIPDAIWIPAIQEASLQDDETLQERWAWLLANASDSRRLFPMEPAFTAMLKELSPREVRFLDALISELDGLASLELDETSLLRTFADLSRLEGFLTPAEQSDANTFEIMMDVLERNRIVSQHLKPPSISGKDIRMEARSAYDPSSIQLEDFESYYSLTRLGYMFIRACRKPKP